eukprot:767728-Hanusia_phi.AAC.4
MSGRVLLTWRMRGGDVWRKGRKEEKYSCVEKEERRRRGGGGRGEGEGGRGGRGYSDQEARQRSGHTSHPRCRRKDATSLFSKYCSKSINTNRKEAEVDEKKRR